MSKIKLKNLNNTKYKQSMVDGQFNKENFIFTKLLTYIFLCLRSNSSFNLTAIFLPKTIFLQKKKKIVYETKFFFKFYRSIHCTFAISFFKKKYFYNPRFYW